jgi:CheY-like chemotaxis protein
VVIDVQLPGITGIDFVRILQNSREWRTIPLVVISASECPTIVTEILNSGAFLARNQCGRTIFLPIFSACIESRRSTAHAHFLGFVSFSNYLRQILMKMKVMKTLLKRAALPVIASALAASATGCVADTKAQADLRKPAKADTAYYDHKAGNAYRRIPRIALGPFGRPPNWPEP